MSFGESISTCLKKYATFSGRARRSEYWYFALFFVIIYFGLAFLSTSTKNSLVALLWLVVTLALALPQLAVTVRRLHDTGRSGWWFFIGLIPVIGSIAMLIFMIDDTDSEGDKYGPAPKALGAYAA